MRCSRLLSSLVLVALVTVSVPAQTPQFIVPANYAALEAGSRNNYPFGLQRNRTQMIYDGTKLGFKQGAVLEIAFRRDGMDTRSYGPNSYPMKIWASISPRTDKTASVQFALNRGPNPVKIFDATLNLPQVLMPAAPPAPFELKLPLPALWMYRGGNICLEFEAGGLAGTLTWMIDCFFNREGGSGTKTSFGTPCSSQAPNPPKDPYLSATASRLLIGKNVEIALYSYRPATPCILFLGLNKAFWGPLPLPFDLTPMGGTGCQVLVESAVIFVATSHPSQTTGVAKFAFDIPDDMACVGLPATIQGFVPDLAANVLGLLSSDGMDISFGVSTANWEGVQMIYAADPLAESGSTSTGANGSVTRFTGPLN